MGAVRRGAEKGPKTEQKRRCLRADRPGLTRISGVDVGRKKRKYRRNFLIMRPVPSNNQLLPDAPYKVDQHRGVGFEVDGN